VRAAETDLRAAGRIAAVEYRERDDPPLSAEIILLPNSS
jgi:hypothetical protein